MKIIQALSAWTQEIIVKKAMIVYLDLLVVWFSNGSIEMIKL